MVTQPPVEIGQFLRPQAIADALDVSIETIYELLNDGTLEGVRVRGQWRISMSAYRSYLEEHSNRKKGELGAS